MVSFVNLKKKTIVATASKILNTYFFSESIFSDVNGEDSICIEGGMNVKSVMVKPDVESKGIQVSLPIKQSSSGDWRPR